MNTNKIENDPNIFRKCKCGICKKKVATRLCDFVTEYRQPAFFREYEDFSEQELHGTCSFPMCDECTSEYNRIYDFCPHHKKMIAEVQPTKEMKKYIGEYQLKEMFDFY